MSYQETIRGKIKEVELVGTIEETAEKILKEKQIKIPDYYDSHLEYLMDEDGEYFVASEKLFQIIEKKAIEDESDFCELEKNEDGTFDFFTSFYNGGICLTEMLEKSLEKKMKELLQKLLLKICEVVKYPQEIGGDVQ